ARRLVHGLKYEDRHDMAGWMTAQMARSGAEILERADRIVPVPLHPSRLRERTYNQAERLASGLAKHSGRPLDRTSLARVRPTRPQVGLGENERLANVRDAFAVAEPHRPAIAGRTVVLVDDVITTGATVEACARALMRAGAYAVDVIAFSKVVDGVADGVVEGVVDRFDRHI
ncbi:MAG: ComF family protein, partial [Pseudomonadota bacterium]